MKENLNKVDDGNDWEGFQKVYTDINSGGTVWRHDKVLETVDDYPDVYEIATDMAKEGGIIKILPILHEKDILRDKLFKGAKDRKCPDMDVNGVYVDVKTISGAVTNNNIDNNIHKAYKQANSLVIRIPGDVTYTRLKILAKNRFNRHSELNRIEFKLIGNKYIWFTRRSSNE